MVEVKKVMNEETIFLKRRGFNEDIKNGICRACASGRAKY
jgi:hypothetical protein